MTFVALIGLSHPLAALAEWNPDAGQWGKVSPYDLRVMTWNVYDGLRTGAVKTEGFNSWTALAQTVAALQPDILLLQETGDHGTPGGVDNASQLAVVLSLFFTGGDDPYTPGQPAVTAYVQKYAPGFDMPFHFVGDTDGFNRNIIVSRFPFGDLNGDGKSTYADIPLVQANAYAPGGDGGIRGFQFAELHLPEAIYRGDLVVGNAHLKAGGSSSDAAQRLTAARNVAYVIDHWYNGGGAGVPDPDARIIDFPAAQQILYELTPVVIGGDWNEDEAGNGRRGPAVWLTEAAVTGGTDGADRDRSDSRFDNARHPFTNSPDTLGSSKLDYIAWQDSIVSERLSFVFNTQGMPGAAIPSEFSGFLFPSAISNLASDHSAVVADLILPIVHDDGDGDLDLADVASLQNCFGNEDVERESPCAPHDTNLDRIVGPDDNVAALIEGLIGPR